MHTPHIYIQGIGAIASTGQNHEEIAEAIWHDRCQLAPLTRFETEMDPPPLVSELPASLIPDTEGRLQKIAQQVIAQALQDAGIKKDAPQLKRAGLFVGTITGMRTTFEEEFRKHKGKDPASFPKIIAPGSGRLAEEIALDLGIEGPVMTYSTACTSSSMALLHARKALQTGLLKHAIVLGIDMLTSTHVHAFSALRLLDPQGSRPFDVDRQGIHIGEGAAAMFLSTTHTDTSQATMIGGASLGHPYHITASDPDGQGALETMLRACRDADIQPDEIDAIKAHGTGSDINDQTECKAMSRAFSTPPLFTSLKRDFGHTMGASGLLECCAFLACLRKGFIPKTSGCTTPDPTLGMSPLLAHQPASKGTWMMNTFGFGGSCTTFIVQTK